MEKVKIKNIFDFQKKSKIKAGDGFKLGEGQYPFYTSSNELTKSINEYLFEDESLIFGTGGLASIHFCNEKFAVSTDCFVIQPKDKNQVFSKFVYYYLSGNMNILENGFKGAGLKHISKDYLENIEIPLPNLATQQRIAAILDQADAIIQNNRAIVQKYEALTQSLFLDMFGGTIFNKVNFNDIADNRFKGTFSNGPFGSDLLTSELIDSGVPVIYIRDIAKGTYLRKSTVFVTDEKAEYLKNCQVISGDVLIAKVGTPPGTAAIYPEGEPMGVITQDVIRIRVNKLIIKPEFLQFWFNTNIGFETLSSIMVQGTRMRFGLGDLKKTKIGLPPIELQNQFAERVAMIEAQKQLAQLELAKSEELFQSLLQRAFKGELN